MAKTIQIFTGPIHVLYTENIEMDKCLVSVKKGEKEIIENGRFYSVGGEKYENMDYRCVLPSYEEAEIYLDTVIERKNDEIKWILQNKDISLENKEKYKTRITNMSSCLFYRPEELVPENEITKDEYKQYRKERKNKK